MSETLRELAHVGDDDFRSEVLESALPVVVDFYAEWCPPCKMLAPVLERVAQRYAGRVKVVKCDSERDALTAKSYGVGKIPNLMFFKDGEVVQQFVGYIGEAQLAQMLEAFLLENEASLL